MLSNSERLKVVFVAGHTRRWHAECIIGEERVDSHTWGMLALIHILHPAPSVALLGAVTFHDAPGEPFSGDIPYGAKVAFPALGDADREIGDRTARAAGVDYGISPGEKWWLNFADMAQALLFAKRQVAQGNTLLAYKVEEIVEQLHSLGRHARAPENAATLVDDVLGCDVSSPLIRNLVQLEAKAYAVR